MTIPFPDSLCQLRAGGGLSIEHSHVVPLVCVSAPLPSRPPGRGPLAARGEAVLWLPATPKTSDQPAFDPATGRALSARSWPVAMDSEVVTPRNGPIETGPCRRVCRA